MANLQKCVTGLEAANDALNAIVSKALGYPRVGQHVGGGLHVNMPPTWDGQGATPPGWTKQVVANYVASALDSVLPLSDSLVTVLQGGAAQALLTGLEIATLTAAIAGRVTVDLDGGGYVPKASAAAKSQAVAAESGGRV